MTVWLPPHISKIYEALTAIADNRIEMVGENEAKITSSSRGKFYTITYDPTTSSIMSNDNTAYYTGSISYPMIALLMLKGVINYDKSLLAPLSNIVWKDVMQKYKNDYDKGIEHVLNDLSVKGINIEEMKVKIIPIYDQALSLKLNYLGKKIMPPKAY